MRVPENISTLEELVNWIKTENPTTIDIPKKSLLLNISEFQLKVYKKYRGRKVRYEKS